MPLSGISSSSLSILFTLLPLAGELYVNGAAGNCAAATGGVNDPFCTVGEGLGAAGPGDTIRIAPGTYVEDLVLTQDVTLIGTQGDDVTFLGGAGGCVVIVESGVHAQLVGVTLQSGLNRQGAGLWVRRGTPSQPTTVVLRDSTVKDNCACLYPPATQPRVHGGGIAAFEDTSLTLERCLVSNNWARDFTTSFAASAFGAGLYSRGTVVILDCLFDSNLFEAANGIAGQIVCTGSLTLSGTTFADSGVWMVTSTLTASGGGTVEGTTFASNPRCLPSEGFPEAVHVPAGSPPLLVRNSILWQNCGLGEVRDPGGVVTVDSSNVQGGWAGAGSNNIDLDPLFAKHAAGDVSLLAGSPCIDAGDPSTTPSATALDLAGFPRLMDGDLDRAPRIDMGAYEFDNVRLALSGNATAGGVLTVDAVGTPGATAFLGLGSMAGATFFHPIGTLFFDLAAPWVSVALGPLPATITLTIPLTVPVPSDAVFQALAIFGPLPSGYRPGNLSNPITLRIQ